jgi:hypothetical protein
VAEDFGQFDLTKPMIFNLDATSHKRIFGSAKAKAVFDDFVKNFNSSKATMARAECRSEDDVFDKEMRDECAKLLPSSVLMICDPQGAKDLQELQKQLYCVLLWNCIKQWASDVGD